MEQTLLTRLPASAATAAVADVGDDAEAMLAPLLLFCAAREDLLHGVARRVVLDHGVQVGAVHHVRAGLVGVGDLKKVRKSYFTNLTLLCFVVPI